MAPDPSQKWAQRGVVSDEISLPRLKLFEGSASARNSEQAIFQDHGAEFMRALQWLAEAPDNFIIKFTGGCLNMSEAAAEGLYELMIEAFDGSAEHQSYAGALLGGATVSLLKGDEAIRRASMPEVVPLLERIYPNLRALGLVPAARATKQSDGSLLVHRDSHGGKEWEIKLDPYQRKVVLVSESTDYLWDAEGRSAIRVRQALDMMRPQRGAVLVSYDGGRGTRNEIDGWLRQPSTAPAHVVLVRGGESNRTTDALAHNEVWLRRYRGRVHIVEKSPEELNRVLRQLGAFKKIGSGGVSEKITAA